MFFIQSNEKTPFTGFYAIHPIIHQLVEPPLALTTWSNYFLYGFISLSHCWGGILEHFLFITSVWVNWRLWVLVALLTATALQEGWGLDFESLQHLYSCTFSDILLQICGCVWEHFLLHDPALAVGPLAFMRDFWQPFQTSNKCSVIF